MATTQAAISKRRKFVADGVFYAELNEFFQRELAEEGYSGVEVRVTPTVTDISMHTIPLTVPGLLSDQCLQQSSVQHIPKKSLASKADEFANSPPSSRNDSSSPRTLSPSTPPRFRTEVSQLSLSASLYDTSCSMVWLCEELATVFYGSSWRAVRRAVKSLLVES